MPCWKVEGAKEGGGFGDASKFLVFGLSDGYTCIHVFIILPVCYMEIKLSKFKQTLNSGVYRCMLGWQNKIKQKARKWLA